MHNADNADIVLNGNTIKQVKSTKYHIDEHLSWTIHINHLSKTIARNVGMLNKLNICSAIVHHEDFMVFINIISSAILCPVVVKYIHNSLKKDTTEKSIKDNYEITIYITYRPCIFKIKTVNVK